MKEDEMDEISGSHGGVYEDDSLLHEGLVRIEDEKQASI
jgi:hypothetical protein